MDPDSKDPPPPHEAPDETSHEDALEPETLVLQGDSIVSDSAPATPLYKLSRDIHIIPKATDSPITFERITAPKSDPVHLFDLGHAQSPDPGAPEYYLTYAARSEPRRFGIGLRPSPKYTFPETRQLDARVHQHPRWDYQPSLLFTMKPRWLSTTEYNYLDEEGRQLACEERETEDEWKLVITVPMARRTRDALVAVWCLRVWRETVEQREAGLRKEVAGKLTPPEAMKGYRDPKVGRRVGTLAGAGD